MPRAGSGGVQAGVLRAPGAPSVGLRPPRGAYGGVCRLTGALRAREIAWAVGCGGEVLSAPRVRATREGRDARYGAGGVDATRCGAGRRGAQVVLVHSPRECWGDG